MADRLAAAGPLFADDGVAMVGSLLIVQPERVCALNSQGPSASPLPLRLCELVHQLLRCREAVLRS